MCIKDAKYDWISKVSEQWISKVDRVCLSPLKLEKFHNFKPIPTDWQL